MTSKSTTRFCILTYGRAGSTSLMKTLGSYADIAIPQKNIPHLHSELLHPRLKRKNKRHFSKLLQTSIRTDEDLINAFFQYNRDYAFAGLKIMPLFMKNFSSFLQRDDIHFIVLTRKDIPSMVASFQMARKSKRWQRTGGKHDTKWVFRPMDRLSVRGNIGYLRKSHDALTQVKDAIRITYEEISSPTFNNPELNTLFGREIRLPNPQGPTCGADYVENWEEFKTYVETTWNALGKRA